MDVASYNLEIWFLIFAYLPLPISFPLQSFDLILRSITKHYMITLKKIKLQSICIFFFFLYVLYMITLKVFN